MAQLLQVVLGMTQVLQVVHRHQPLFQLLQVVRRHQPLSRQPQEREALPLFPLQAEVLE